MAGKNYIYEGRRRSRRSNEHVSTPFAKLAASSDYIYFDLNYIFRSFHLTQADRAEARRLAEKGTVKLEDVVCGFVPGFPHAAPVLQAYGTVDVDGLPYSTSVCFGNSGEVTCDCDCPSCYPVHLARYEGDCSLCTHVWALLFLLEDYILQYNPGDATSSSSMEILQNYRQIRSHAVRSPLSQERDILCLEPRLENRPEGLAASFKVGTDKLYLIRDLTQFVDQVDAGETVRFGKSTSIDFSDTRPDESSQKYFSFIKEAVREERGRTNFLEERRPDTLPPNFFRLTGTIPLIGGRMDAFYDLVCGRSIEYLDRSSGRTSCKMQLRCRGAAPSLELTIRASRDERKIFDGILVTGKLPSLVEGVRGYYRISDEGYLEKIDEEKMRSLLPLIRLCDTQGELSLQVGRRYLSEFYYSLLPILREYGPVHEPDDQEIRRYLAPEAVFRFYLDVSHGNVGCRAEAVYGDRTVSVTDLFDEEKYKARAAWRDMSREEEAADTLTRYFTAIDPVEEVFHCKGDEDAVYRILSQGVRDLMELGEVHCTDSFRRLRIRPLPRISVGVSLESDIMDLRISSEEMSLDDLLAVLTSYRQKKKYTRLKNGDFVQTDQPGVDVLEQMMESLHLSPREFVKGKMQIPAYRALYLDKMLEADSGIYTRRDSRFRKLVKEFKTVEDSDFEVPESLSQTLRSYQVTGYQWIRTLAAYGFGGILADDMGLGKTIQMIAAFVAWKEEAARETAAPGEGSGTPAEGGPCLVVCPASLLYNWEEEMARFAPSLSVGLIVGTRAERQEILQRCTRYDVLVTSYDSLKRDIRQYEDLHFLCEVLDEAQFIKNHTTAAAKSVRLIHSRYRFALTGTPIENRLSELWSIFDYLMPGFLYEYAAFKKEFETPIVKREDEEASDRLRRMVSPFILRRLKRDVLRDLPDKIEKVYYAKFESPQQQLYDAQVVHMKQILLASDEENFSKDRIRILAELTRIRQICCDPSLLYEDYQGGSAKRSACLELIHRAIEGEHKILLFSQFTSMLALLEEDLKGEGLRYYKITGKTPKKERLEMVHAFNEDETPLFLISLKAGGTGLNLTGADVVIHYDPWWNTAVQNQATDRAHRIGQTHVVSVYRLIAKDSIEEKILRMQEEKENLADTILSGENQGLGSLSRDELLELLDVR